VSSKRLNVEGRDIREDGRQMRRMTWKISDLTIRREDLLEGGMMIMTESADIIDTRSHRIAPIVTMKEGIGTSLDTVTATNEL
jgi:hypothetical protein